MAYFTSIWAVCYELAIFSFLTSDVLYAQETQIITTASACQDAIEVSQAYWTVELKQKPLFPLFWQKITALDVCQLHSCLDDHV
jgi:hypothetical protein